MNTFNKGIAPIIVIIIIVAIAIIGGGAVFYYTREVQPTTQMQQNTETENNQTADWKTYTNTQYEFEFQYPKGWIINDNLTLNTCCLNVSNYDLLKKQNQFLDNGEIKIQIAHYTKQASITLIDFVASQTYIESSIKATYLENIDIAGIQAVKSNLTGDGIYYLPKSQIEGIAITIFSNPQDSFKNTVNQILSTFKFTN